MLIGALIYGLNEGKPSELGKICFFCGLFFTLQQYASHITKLP